MATFLVRRALLAGVASALLAVPAAITATAAPKQEPPRSTDAPFRAVKGQVMSYVVNTPKAGPEQISAAEKAVTRAGGTVVQPWPDIGVLIVHSTKAGFLKDIRALKDPAVASAAPTRTVPVTGDAPTGQPNRHESGPDAEPTEDFLPSPVPEHRASSQAPKPGEKPTEPMEAEQWGLAAIKANQAHAVDQGSKDVLVGILDDGIDPTHPDLKANLDPATSVNCGTHGKPDTRPEAWRNNGEAYHGTHVAGIVAAARNGEGVVGVAPEVRIASVKVFDDKGRAYPEYALCGFMWAGQHKMDVTNSSYFIGPWLYWCDDQANQAPVKEAMRRAVNYATRQGTVHAAAAGNAADDLANKTTDDRSPTDATAMKRQVNAQCHDLPTELDGVVSVSAIDKTMTKTLFSSYGVGKVHVAAPGLEILSTMPMDHPKAPKYALRSGTSMATPHVAGVLALLKSTDPAATPAELIARLERQAVDIACPTAYPPTENYPRQQRCTGSAQNNSFHGEGLVNAYASVSER